MGCTLPSAARPSFLPVSEKREKNSRKTKAYLDTRDHAGGHGSTGRTSLQGGETRKRTAGLKGIYDR